jgi:hypothetical protein
MTQEPEPEPNQDPVRPVEYNLGWRIVAASFILPLGMLVTESLSLTLVIAVFAAMIIAKSNAMLSDVFEQDPVFRWFDRIFHVVVLLIFIAALLRNILR